MPRVTTEGKGGRQLNSDQPIQRPADDRFGFGPFAQHVGAAIMDRATASGLVVGLHAPWGSGKSSALNLIEHYLREGNQKRARDHRPLIHVVRFNPWWFSSDPEDLLRVFFRELLASIPTRGAKTRALRGGLAKLAALASESPAKLQPGAKFVLKKAAQLLEPSAETIDFLRKRVERDIEAQYERFVILIDDVDRLSGEEVYQIFRVVKAVANFRRFTYVLSFDREVVARALDRYTPDSGRGYIDKIVQVPFALPPVDRTSLDDAFIPIIDSIIEPIEEGRFEQVRWHILKPHFDALFTTPRAFVRLVNALSVSYPPMRGEVDPVDFIALEALRVAVPEVYAQVASSPRRLTGLTSGYGETKGELDWLRAVVEKAPADVRDAVFNLLCETFPAVRGQVAGGADLAWSGLRRVCSADCFYLYFKWAVPRNKLSAVALADLLQATSDEVAQSIQSLLESDGGQHSVKVLLHDVEAYFEAQHDKQPSPQLLRGVVDSAEALKRASPDAAGLLERTAAEAIPGFVYRMLRRMPSDSQSSFLVAACRESTSLGLMCYLHYLVGKSSGGSTSGVLPENAREELEAVLVPRVEDELERGVLGQRPSLDSILRWCVVVPSVTVRLLPKIAARLEGDRFLAEFLTALLQITYATGGAEGERRIPRFDMGMIRLYLDPEATRRRVERLVGESEGRTREALETFLKDPDEAEKKDEE